MLQMYDEAMNQVVEPDEFEIISGNSSEAKNSAILKLNE